MKLIILCFGILMGFLASEQSFATSCLGNCSEELSYCLGNAGKSKDKKSDCRALNSLCKAKCPSGADGAVEDPEASCKSICRQERSNCDGDAGDCDALMSLCKAKCD